MAVSIQFVVTDHEVFVSRWVPSGHTNSIFFLPCINMCFALTSETLSLLETNFSQDIERWKELISYKLRKKMDGRRREKGTEFSSLHFTTEGKSLRLLHPEFHMETSVWTGHVVLTGHGVRLGLSHWHKDKRLQTGFPREVLSLNIERSYLSRLRCYGERKRARSCYWIEQPWEMVKLCRIPRGCRWACRKYSQCYRYSGYTHLTQKIFVFREYPCSVCGKVQEVIYCTAGLNWNFWV